MKRIVSAALVLAAALAVMVPAAAAFYEPQVDVEKMSIGQCYDLLLSMRRAVFFSEKHPAMGIALSIWFDYNPSITSDPEMTIEDNSIGNNIDISYSFDGMNPFIVHAKGGNVISFTAGSSLDGISKDFLIRFLVTAGYNFDEFDEFVNRLAASEKDTETGGVQYEVKEAYHSVIYTIEPTANEFCKMHTITIKLGK